MRLATAGDLLASARIAPRVPGLDYTSHSMKLTRIAAAVLCLPLVACYEEPVRDHLHIAFTTGPAIVVTAVREIASPSSAGDNQAVEDRLDEARSDLAGGWDRWSRSFAELDAVADRGTIVRHEGRVSRGIHSALVDSFRPIERLLGDQGMGAFFEEAAGQRTLEFFPTGAGLATRQQREEFDRTLSVWSESVAEYLEHATALYAYLDRAPDRAVPCLAHVFDVHAEESGPLSPEEEDLITALKPPMERVADALLIDTGKAYSLNELSRLVFDPFQGRLTVTVDGPVLEMEGFLDRNSFYERPPVELWRALVNASEQWVSPDLVTAMVVPGPVGVQPEPDPVSFASLPRRWSRAPDAWTVESELRSHLQPEEFHRIRWRTRPAPDDEDEIFETAMRMLASAEVDLPK